MYEQEKITPYHDGEKASQVELMFNNIALLKELIEAWMESHGIEFDETNWCAISKRYQRKRELYRKKNAPK